jgi:predicted AAA+ superfamily ATPase
MIRKLFYELLKHLGKNEFSIITGARQTGKSTLLKQLQEYCNEHDAPNIFLNLENNDILHELDRSPLNLLNFIPDTNKRYVVFIDEVQYLSDPSNFLKLIYDEYKGKIKIVATGSSAFYIDQKFNDSLAGRKKIFFLPTCSFSEYLSFTQNDDLLEEIDIITAKRNYISTKIKHIEREYNNYIMYGGYPAVILEKDTEEKISKLAEIRDSFIKRDIYESGVKNETAFYNMFRIIAAQTGNLLNINELSRTLRIDASTVSNYLYIMQKCFHIGVVKPYSKNIRNELTKMPKVYLLDTGLLNVLTDNFKNISERVDKGSYWENIYYRKILEKENIDSINFWRTASGNEVDFIIKRTGNTPYAVETKYSSVNCSEAKYKKFREYYPEIKLFFAFYEPFNENFFKQ